MLSVCKVKISEHLSFVLPDSFVCFPGRPGLVDELVERVGEKVPDRDDELDAKEGQVHLDLLLLASSLFSHGVSSSLSLISLATTW